MYCTRNTVHGGNGTTPAVARCVPPTAAATAPAPAPNGAALRLPAPTCLCVGMATGCVSSDHDTSRWAVVMFSMPQQPTCGPGGAGQKNMQTAVHGTCVCGRKRTEGAMTGQKYGW